MIAPEQKERCVFGPKVLVFPAESHVRLSPSRTREGVSLEVGVRLLWSPPSRRRGGVAAKGRVHVVRCQL
jgi:hypothetical protein